MLVDMRLYQCAACLWIGHERYLIGGEAEAKSCPSCNNDAYLRKLRAAQYEPEVAYFSKAVDPTKWGDDIQYFEVNSDDHE